MNDVRLKALREIVAEGVKLKKRIETCATSVRYWTRRSDQRDIVARRYAEKKVIEWQQKKREAQGKFDNL
jgi:GH24 family phage-related lysozyme (muramidase)